MVKNNKSKVVDNKNKKHNSFDSSRKEKQKNYIASDFDSKQNNFKKKNYVDCVVEIKRVTKVTKGGKRFRFKAYVISGDGEGNIGVSKGVGRDISVAIAKATLRARKFLFPIAKQGSTIPYTVYGKHGASSVILKPAYKGTGVIAGGAVRFVFKAAGIEDVIAKSIGPSRSGTNVVKATLNAVAKGRTIENIAGLRGKTKKEIILGSHNES